MVVSSARVCLMPGSAAANDDGPGDGFCGVLHLNASYIPWQSPVIPLLGDYLSSSKET